MEPTNYVVTVRFMTLSGKFETARTESFGTMEEAKAAVRAHAARAGYTHVKEIEEEEGFGVRFTARTPGGRRGRNIAFADHDFSER